MTEQDQKITFLGTYFDKDAVMRLSKFASLGGWVILGLYLADWIFNIVVFALQINAGFFFEKGQLFYNLVGIISPFVLRPVPGVIYFFSLQAIAHVLLILMEIEGNTRHNLRNMPK